MMEEITANTARHLEKLRRHYERLLEDPLLKANIINIQRQYMRVMDRIRELTDPTVNEEIFSIPGIRRE